MKNVVLLLVLASAALSASAQTCQVTGTIKDIGTKPIVFRYTQQGKQYRDTVRAVNDRFTYAAKPSDDGKINLQFSPSRYTPFWYEPGKLTVAGNVTQPGEVSITGTLENNTFDRYKRTIEWKFAQAQQAQPTAFEGLQAQEQLATRQFIEHNAGTRTAAELLYWQMVYNDKPIEDYTRLLKQLTPAVRQSVQGQDAAKRLVVLRNQPVIGRAAPDFSIADTAGTKFSLAAQRGQYVLLDFWGHWCGPCIEAMPKVKALHAQYTGKLAIIGIAMEDASDATLWKKAIRKHEIPGLQLSELQQAKGPVISGYNITAFPTYMLLDRQGIVIARSSNVDDITKKLSALTDL
jgi:thiol-disulfide isomerase/thioredoxin